MDERLDGIYARTAQKIREKRPFLEGRKFTHKDICEILNIRLYDIPQKMNAKKEVIAPGVDHSEFRLAVHQILYNWSTINKKPILKQTGKYYEFIDYDLPVMNWQSISNATTIPLKLPFGLEEYVNIYPKSLIVIAGAPNAGKTAWLYNVVIKNMMQFSIDLYNNETSIESMRERFLNFEDTIPNPAPFKVYERYDDFASVIDPDGISVIDYIDADNEFWSIPQEMSALHKTLNKGVVITAIQKRRTHKTFKGDEVKYDVGYGGDLTLKKASLYVAIDPGVLRIVKAKSWADPTINPNGMQFKFKLVKGAKFIVERDYENED